MPEKQANPRLLEYIPHDIGMMENPAVDVGLKTINNLIKTSLPPAAPASSVNPMQIIAWAASRIWFVGFVILLAYGIVSYLEKKWFAHGQPSCLWREQC